MKLLNALLVEPEQPPREIWVESTAEGILSHIGGAFVSRYNLPDDSVSYLFNANARNEGKRLNRAVLDDSGKITLLIAGSFLIVGRLFEEGVCGLCPEQVERYGRLFAFPHVFVRQNGQITLWQKEGA